MKIVYGDLFENPSDGDAICVSTNGVVKRDGCAVMGAGIAKEFADRWGRLPALLGAKIKDRGNHVYGLLYVRDVEKDTKYAILSFPTKEHFKDKSDIELIKRSCKELVILTDNKGFKNVYLPLPGCGLGGLKKEDVVPELEKILDDRFVLVLREES
ncbi:MAG: macro domain-containing protein [Butyrivibrio sp.]|uniref:macro domain-containing protein n=1 Tax=Butyrivibrio sp. TaxID=28121 RepID=UPI001B4E1C58|nr:macro domain-containing protein [Butyrivibrio sp.]MBP3781634.1 macro domain-containing protein [Butyrivibrio sp.]